MSMPSMEEMQMQQAQKAQFEERRLSILDQVLEPEAKARLNRLAIVKKELTRAVEDSIIQGATSGKLQGKVTEEQLIVMLEGITGKGGQEEGGVTKKRVTVQRKKYAGMDEEEDDDDSDLL